MRIALALLLVGLIAAPAGTQAPVGFTFFGSRGEDVIFERIGFRVAVIGGRSGLLIAGDLAGFPPDVVEVSVMNHAKSVVCVRADRVAMDAFSVFCPGVQFATVAGIFVHPK